MSNIKVVNFRNCAHLLTVDANSRIPELSSANSDIMWKVEGSATRPGQPGHRAGSGTSLPRVRCGAFAVADEAGDFGAEVDELGELPGLGLVAGAG